MLVMLTYVACSVEKNVIEESITNKTQLEDKALKAAYWEEILQMEESGASGNDISAAFYTPGKEIKSREEFYRFQTFMKYMHQKNIERKKAEGTYDKKKEAQLLDALENTTYDEYVARKSAKNPTGITEVIERGDATNADIPFAVVEIVPVFPGCESLGSNEEKKKCMTEKVSEYVNVNFDTSLGKKLGLKGMNRVITLFKISPEGNITNVRARAPHPDLEAEAIRVVGSLPQMVPGVHNGNNVGVSYSLPIVFQVNE